MVTLGDTAHVVGEGNEGFVCYGCGEDGHIARDCQD